MQIGEVIHKYRRRNELTQEELARRLGVTAPAVNKWEKGVSQPDISLLAPIARLLGITLDTLLSFQEALTSEEIAGIIRGIDQQFAHERYDDVFQYAAGIIRQYPNCFQLIWQLAVVLNARSILDETVNQELYEQQIVEWYQQALENGDEKLKQCAADSLFTYYVRKENYKEAEQYICYFSEESVEKKRKQAVIYSKTNRREQAYKVYEEILFSECQILNLVLYSLYSLSAEDNDLQQAAMWVEKESDLAKLFDMGIYQAEVYRLELAARQKDVDKTISSAKRLMESVNQIYAFAKSPMYLHMHFRDIDKTVGARQKKNLWKALCEKETFGYMEGNAEWEELLNYQV